jgi:mRNA interferase YafQ
MREILYGKKFEKSIKLAKKRKKDLEKLFKLVESLRKDEPIPARHRNHKLVGDYDGYWELHIEPDWLLVYKKATDKLYLFDTGTHADLFE